MKQKLPYVSLGTLAIVTATLGGWWRVVAVVMVAVGVGCWAWERRRLPRIVPLLVVAAILVPSLSACGKPEHPIPVAMQAVAPTADTGCVIAVGVTGATGIFTFASTPLNWIGVALWGAGFPSLAACQSEFTDTHFSIRVFYDCGQGVRYFTVAVANIDWVGNQFRKAHCGEDGNYIPWIDVF